MPWPITLPSQWPSTPPLAVQSQSVLSALHLQYVSSQQSFTPEGFVGEPQQPSGEHPPLPHWNPSCSHLGRLSAALSKIQTATTARR